MAQMIEDVMGLPTDDGALEEILLGTRMAAPGLGRHHVARPLLVERMREGIAEGRRVTLISAPPGCGKTTLAVEWLHQHTGATAWLSIDEGDNDPVQFLRYVIAAVRQQQPIMQDLHDILASPQLPPPSSLMAIFINTLAAHGQPLVLVFDDYHRISNPDVHALVRQLIARQPSHLHLMIVTREDPPLLLHQVRASRKLTEIRQRDLRFDRVQVAAYLSAALDIVISDDQAAALGARTEGWVTGLQLATLAIQERPDDASDFIRDFTGGDRYITDYLVGEVLGRLPPAQAEFLRATSVLTQFTAALCDAVIQRDDSASVLTALESANLFLVPLDRQRTWYRYHQLFADVLRGSLSPTEQTSLHERALAWYEAQAAFGDAWHHARELLRLTGDASSCMRLLKRAADGWFRQGAVTTLRQWLGSLSTTDIQDDPELCVIAGWTAALQGDFPAAMAAQERARGRVANADNALTGRLLGLDAFCTLFAQRDYERVSALTRDALQHLDAAQDHWRVIVAWLSAEAARRAGKLETAIAEIRKLDAAGLMRHRSFFALVVETGLISCLYLHGELNSAQSVCEELVTRFTDEAGQPSPLLGIAWAWLGRLHYEKHDLQAAQQYLERSVAESDALGLEIYQLIAHGYRSLLLYAQGNMVGALDDLERAESLSRRTQFAEVTWFAAWRANIHIREGDLDASERWVKSLSFDAAQPLNYLQLETYLTLVRLRIAQQAFADAEAWLNRLQAMVDVGGFGRAGITLLLLRASIAERQGNRKFLYSFAEAVKMAAGEGWVRLILDEDERLLPHLLRVRDTAPAFVDVLINASLRTRDPDALSERELEVLQLLAAGLNTSEIAGRLMIAPGTVKRHLHHIYEKLGVGSRVQAVNRARAMKLVT